MKYLNRHGLLNLTDIFVIVFVIMYLNNVLRDYTLSTNRYFMSVVLMAFLYWVVRMSYSYWSKVSDYILLSIVESKDN